MLPSRFKTHPNNLLKLSVMSLVVATLSGCGEDTKDCAGFWDKTFGRDSCTITPSVPAPKPAPVCTTTEFLDAPNNVCKAKEAQSITGLNLPALSVGDKATLVATTNSGLAVSYASQTIDVCTIAGVEVTAIAAGTCSVSANQSGDATHLAATQVVVNQLVTPACNVNQFLDITNNVCKAKATQTITGLTLPALSVGDKTNLAASSTSGLTVSYASQTPTICTVNTKEVTAIAKGTCTISANQAGDGTRLAAAQVLVNQLVTPVCSATEFLDAPNNVCKAKATQTITGLALPALSVGDKTTLAASSNSGLAVSYTSQTAAICTVNAKEVTAIAAGTCSIAANQSGDATHLAATQVLVNQLVTPVCSATEFLDVASNECKAKSSQVITSLTLPALSVGSKVALSAIADSGLTVSYASQTIDVCTVAGVEVTAIAAGTCSISANQSGDTTHLAAEPVLASQLVTPVCLEPQLLDTLTNACVNPPNMTINAPVSTTVGEQITLTLQNVWSTVVQVVWSFGQGIVDVIANVGDTINQTFTKVGNYTVTATAKNASGNVVTTATQTVAASCPSNMIDYGDHCDVPSNFVGQFIDSAVEGVSYITSTKSGVTDKDGHIYFDTMGEPIQLSIGKTILGTFNANKIMHVFDLQANSSFNNQTQSQRVAQILQTLDEDSNPENGIQLSAQTRQLFNTKPAIDFSVTQQAWDKAIEQIAQDTNKQVVAMVDAISHATLSKPADATCIPSTSYKNDDGLGGFGTNSKSCNERAAAMAFFDDVSGRMHRDVSEILNSQYIANGEEIAQKAVEDNAKKNLANNMVQAGTDFASALDSLDEGTKAVKAAVIIDTSVSLIKGINSIVSDDKVSLSIAQLVTHTAVCLSGNADRCIDALDDSPDLIELLEEGNPNKTALQLAEMRKTLLNIIKPHLETILTAAGADSKGDFIELAGGFVELLVKDYTGAYTRTTEETAHRSTFNNTLEVSAEGVKTATTCIAAVVPDKDFVDHYASCASEVADFLTNRFAEIFEYSAHIFTVSDLRRDALRQEMARLVLSEKYRYGSWDAVMIHYNINKDDWKSKLGGKPSWRIINNVYNRASNDVFNGLKPLLGLTDTDRNKIWDLVILNENVTEAIARKIIAGKYTTCALVSLDKLISPDIFVTPNGKNLFPFGEKEQFTANFTPSSAVKYLFNWGDGSVVTSSDIAASSHTFFKAGDFNVSVTPLVLKTDNTWHECSAKAQSLYVTVSPALMSIKPSSTTVYKNEEMTAKLVGVLETTLAEIKRVVWSFAWHFIEVTTDFLADVAQSFANVGDAQIWVTMYDNAEQMIGDTLIANVKVLYPPTLKDIDRKTTVRLDTASYQITGEDLPTTGITIEATGGACVAPNNMTATGFGTSCEFTQVGEQTLTIKTAEARVIGTLKIAVTSNVNAVSWLSDNGTIKFGDKASFVVRGTHLTSGMGFAIEKCGVSNTEVNTPSSSDIERTFECTFNDEAGAVAGQMAGVVKDMPSGQVLFGFTVPVEVNSVGVPATGVTSSQCMTTTDIRKTVNCSDTEAISTYDRQDGMLANKPMSYALVQKNSLGENFDVTECVKDTVTGLIWEGKMNDGGMRDSRNVYTNYDSTVQEQIYSAQFPSQQQINSITNSIGYVNYVNSIALCGYTDWRRPNLYELLSLVDYGGSSWPSLAINSMWFPNTMGLSPTSTSAVSYLTSSKYPENRFGAQQGEYAEASSVVFGLVYWGFANAGDWVVGSRVTPQYLRLVRGDPYITEDSSRFIPMGDKVLDKNTGLTWKRCLEGQVWSGSTCDGSPTPIYGNIGAFSYANQILEWRLPNIKELGTLINPNAHSPSNFGYSVFPKTDNNTYPIISSTPLKGFSGAPPFNGIYDSGMRICYTSRVCYVRMVK